MPSSYSNDYNNKKNNVENYDLAIQLELSSKSVSREI